MTDVTVARSSSQTGTSPEERRVKYLKPKVLLVDMPASAAEALLRNGFNASVGTFGQPYVVQRSADYLPLISQPIPPNHSEQEIVIVDLSFESSPYGAPGQYTPTGDLHLWGKCNRGLIDPRPLATIRVCQAFDRILDNGGVFVVFGNEKTDIELRAAKSYDSGPTRQLFDQQECTADEWGFLDCLARLEVVSEFGSEMHCLDSSPLGNLISQHLSDGQFRCTINVPSRPDVSWFPLVKNKFGDTVSLLGVAEGKGIIVILPQLADKSGFLEKLFVSVLPEIAPHLFPDMERGRWTHHPEYELPRILAIKEEQERIRSRATTEIHALEMELESERTISGWQHDLLTATGSELVEAVKKALAALGFSDITDVDEERDAQGKTRREDLQILDASPTLIVDVKGVGGRASDEDVLQADKHATIRMREWNRTDVVGLSIINHQRHLPPLDRDNAMPFRQELIDAAIPHKLGLLTAWDLYRLVRNTIKHGWSREHVKPLFYQPGRIQVVPTHYHFLGTVDKVWTGRFGIVIQEGQLQLGDEIAVEFPIEFEQGPVTSMHVSGKDVETAKADDQLGLLWPADNPRLREGMRVYGVERVIQTS